MSSTTGKTSKDTIELQHKIDAEEDIGGSKEKISSHVTVVMTVIIQQRVAMNKNEGCQP